MIGLVNGIRISANAGLAVLGVGDVDHVAQPAAQGLVAVAGEALDQELGLMQVEDVQLL